MADAVRRLTTGLVATALLGTTVSLASALSGVPLVSFLDPVAHGYAPFDGAPGFVGAAAYWAVALLSGSAGTFFAWAALSRGKPAPRWYRLPRQNRGDPPVRIARRAPSALVCYVAEHVQGVRRCQAEVLLTRRGWDVQAHVKLDREARVGHVLDMLKLRIGASLKDHTGLPLARLSIEPAMERRLS